jgi:YD repeat-containing protein
MKMGKGFKLSLQETLVSKDIDGTDYFVYNDGDGTEHYYFHYTEQNKYIAESGNGLELTVGSNGNTKYTITDELGNKKYFNTNGYVTRILDVHGNKKEFVYNSSNQLTSVTSTTKGQPTETQLTLTYNTNGALKPGGDIMDHIRLRKNKLGDGAKKLFHPLFLLCLRDHFVNGGESGEHVDDPNRLVKRLLHYLTLSGVLTVNGEFLVIIRVEIHIANHIIDSLGIAEHSADGAATHIRAESRAIVIYPRLVVIDAARVLSAYGAGKNVTLSVLHVTVKHHLRRAPRAGKIMRPSAQTFRSVRKMLARIPRSFKAFFKSAPIRFVFLTEP